MQITGHESEETHKLPLLTGNASGVWNIQGTIPKE